MHRFGAFALSAVAISAPAFAGPDWVENTDAGDSYLTAQAVIGIGTPQRILGTLTAGGFGAGDYEDVYLIRIEQPGTFTFTIENAAFDSQLYLFNVTLAGQLLGLLHNNDYVGVDASIYQSVATDTTLAAVTKPGVYALAITGAGRYPKSVNGAIFFSATPTELSGPDGPGGLNPLNGWLGDGDTGTYEIAMDGAGYVDVPGPGVLGVVGCAGVWAVRRRRARG